VSIGPPYCQPLTIGLSRNRTTNNIQPGGIYKRSKVPVAGKKRDIMIDASLSDEGISQPRLAMLG
jgi:hypothetical protein